ncbi:MAG: 50S ribosomal protein L28 [Alphaproteobacteria bacterium]|jgi:large subunit ribosomal protein L28|nr:50S ribosomal protein L28 [Alphaproteobacteria bacterium]
MARVCQITGKKLATGNNVAHSKKSTRRTFLPNLHVVSFLSEVLGQKIQLRLSKKGIKTVEHNGGIDSYLLNKPNSKLTDDAKKLKKRVVKAKAKKEASAK